MHFIIIFYCNFTLILYIYIRVTRRLNKQLLQFFRDFYKSHEEDEDDFNREMEKLDYICIRRSGCVYFLHAVSELGKHDVDEELLIICLGAEALLTSWNASDWTEIRN